VHGFATDVDHDLALTVLAQRDVGQPCTPRVIDGSDWIVVAGDAASARVIVSKVGGDLQDVADDAGTPVSYKPLGCIG
jgi:hypothetical protein